MATPLLREGVPIGVINVRRKTPQPFTEKEITLLKTFADQAVIAIENVRLFQEIQDKNDQLEAANQHKSQFLANVSHELRTPLNSIIGFTRIVLRRSEGKIEPLQKENLQKVLVSSDHLLTLINELLDLAKIEAGRMGRQAAGLIDKIIKGEKPDTLAIERAAKFDLTLNYRTARFLDLTFTPEMLKKADKVIR